MVDAQQTTQQENPYTAPSETVGATQSRFVGYAGFWKRFAAVVVDTLILLPVGFVLGLIVGVVYAGLAGPAANPATAELFGNILGTIAGWLYFATFESSNKQGTPGKMALGIAVTDTNGERIGFGRATGRHFAKILSSLILFIGFIMAGFTERKQTLHDMVAGCLVVNRG